jgi:carbohydrate diacid regulator
MIISETLAQRIVDSVAGLVHCNVNVMNAAGIIIGTAQPDRRGAIHKGAQDVMESGGAVEIYPGDTPLFPGTREGVNLPLALDGQIIGAIGVTGNPDAVRGIARLTKMITELILERELLQQETMTRVRLSEQLTELLLWSAPPVDRRRVLRAAKALRLDMDLTRAVAVADVSGLTAIFKSLYGHSDLVAERSAELILQELNESGVTGAGDLAVVVEDRLIVLAACEADQPAKALARFGLLLQERSRAAWGRGVPCGAGAAAATLDEYAHSYRQAMFCLRSLGPGGGFACLYEHRMAVAYMFHEFGRGKAAMAFRPLWETVRPLLSGKPEIRETLQTFLALDREMDATAHALDIHRNTLAYRLARFKERTGLDPLRHDDHAMALRVLLVMSQERAAQE